MKKFTFKYTTTVWLLLSVVLILSIAGFTLNVYNLIAFIKAGVFKIIVYAIISLLTLILTILVISVMLYGKYVIDNGYLYSYFGFIKSKTKLTEIVQVTHFKKSNKLVLYFKDGKYMVVVINPELYDSFVLSLRENNKNIIFSTKIDDEDTPL